MEFRFATPVDAPLLAEMNHCLIRDEGHRNRNSVGELQRRMEEWIESGEYRAVLFSRNTMEIGYSLFREEDEHIYVRQYYVAADSRRQGIATEAWDWLTENPWKNASRIRLDVLVGNDAGIAFWKSLGFVDYCVTMERDRPRKP